MTCTIMVGGTFISVFLYSDLCIVPIRAITQKTELSLSHCVQQRDQFLPPSARMTCRLVSTGPPKECPGRNLANVVKHLTGFVEVRSWEEDAPQLADWTHNLEHLVGGQRPQQPWPSYSFTCGLVACPTDDRQVQKLPLAWALQQQGLH